MSFFSMNQNLQNIPIVANHQGHPHHYLGPTKQHVGSERSLSLSSVGGGDLCSLPGTAGSLSLPPDKLILHDLQLMALRACPQGLWRQVEARD